MGTPFYSQLVRSNIIINKMYLTLELTCIINMYLNKYKSSFLFFPKDLFNEIGI